VLNDVRRQSFLRNFEVKLPEPVATFDLRIEDIGDIFNYQYLFNWQEEDPLDFFEHSFKEVV